MRNWVVAIDGPAGTGKSSVTKRLADELGWTHVDTGAIYRTIAWTVIDPIGTEAFIALTSEELEPLAVKAAENLDLKFVKNPKKNPSQRVLSRGKDITHKIRQENVSLGASRVSAFPGVRKALLSLQRDLGRTTSSILEGRDIGTVVFPDADVKFYLTASVEERAKRRLAELDAAGMDPPSFEEMKRKIQERDNADSTRKTAPLRQAPDAILIDTTELTLDQVVQQMKAKIQEQLIGKT